jgi:hypothetical protein
MMSSYRNSARLVGVTAQSSGPGEWTMTLRKRPISDVTWTDMAPKITEGSWLVQADERP